MLKFVLGTSKSSNSDFAHFVDTHILIYRYSLNVIWTLAHTYAVRFHIDRESGDWCDRCTAIGQWILIEARINCGCIAYMVCIKFAQRLRFVYALRYLFSGRVWLWLVILVRHFSNGPNESIFNYAFMTLKLISRLKNPTHILSHQTNDSLSVGTVTFNKFFFPISVVDSPGSLLLLTSFWYNWDDH